MMARDYTRALVVGKVVTLTAVEPDKYRKRLTAYLCAIAGRVWAMPRLLPVWRGPIAAGGD
jgi:hypothetical protein